MTFSAIGNAYFRIFEYSGFRNVVASTTYCMYYVQVESTRVEVLKRPLKSSNELKRFEVLAHLLI